jgi:sulfate adenylyltransferase large subunit
MDLLRFSTMGSVDDGKSTLIGRLLYESNGIYEDQFKGLERAGAPDFSLVTDGLRAEREQGITIDVAYRHFATPRRRFIIADTPGHEQYTRNMATGASTADLGIILIDARNGVLPQSRRHAYIANLLGIRHFVVAINKMDLVGYSEEIYNVITAEFAADTPNALFIPVCATTGENIVTHSPRTPWYSGPTLLEHLETVDTTGQDWRLPPRFPVQLVIRPSDGSRRYAGQIVSGSFSAGDAVMVLPSRRQTRITQIENWSIALEDDLDISRGDMIVDATAPPHVSRKLRARCVWMNARPLTTGASFFIKHTTQQMRCVVHSAQLNLNDIGEVSVETNRPLFFDAYSDNRATGAAILIDPVTNETVAALMIVCAEGSGETRGPVTDSERKARYGHAGEVFAADDHKSALALERDFFDRGMTVAIFPDEASAQSAAKAGLVAIYLTCDRADLNKRQE